MAGIYNFPNHKRGDTFEARDIATITQGGQPVAITSALLQFRTKAGCLVHEWTTGGDSPNASITGAGSNTVHLDEVDADTCAEWPAIICDHDLELVLATGITATFIQGTILIEPDTSRP